MSLKTQILQLLDDFHAGKRPVVETIKLLNVVVQNIPDDLPDIGTTEQKIPDVDQSRVTGLPTRFAARNWGFTVCKRCMGTAADGEIIVRIYGTGWWHDKCYKIVNPKFYEGIDN
jgi:hypothetical protein